MKGARMCATLDPESSPTAYTPPLYPLPPQLTCVSAESLRSSLQMYAARHAFTQYSIDTEMLCNSVLCHGEVALYMSDLLRLSICSSLAYAFARLAHHVSVAAEHILGTQ